MFSGFKIYNMALSRFGAYIIAVIQRKLDGIMISPLELSSLIDCLSEKAEIIKRLKEKIINQCDDTKTEIVESEEYSYDFSLEIQKLHDTSRKQTQNATNNSYVVRKEDPMVQRQARLSTYMQHKIQS